MGDYQKLLEEAGRFVMHPAVTASVSFAAGTIIGPSIQHWRSDRRNERDMREVVYKELADLFGSIESIMAFDKYPEPQRWEWREHELKALPLKAEEYIAGRHEVFVRLREYRTIQMVYHYFHEMLDNESWVAVNWCVARQVFAQAVCEKQLSQKYFRRFVGRDRANRLVAKCREIHEDSQRRLQAMGFPVEAPVNGR